MIQTLIILKNFTSISGGITSFDNVKTLFTNPLQKVYK